MGKSLTNILTSRQLAILKFIRLFSVTNGFSPSLREIATSFEIAPSSVLDHLKALERKGFIRRHPFQPRCLEVINKDF